jgi:phosphoglucomutase
VRDPLQTLTSILKLMVLVNRGKYSPAELLASLPAHTTTGVAEDRAQLRLRTTDHAALKRRFGALFAERWKREQGGGGSEGKKGLFRSLGIETYEALTTNGMVERPLGDDYGESGRGGLKLLFRDKKGELLGFMWMRGSGTEPVFRILCDLRGRRPEAEGALLALESELLREADRG